MLAVSAATLVSGRTAFAKSAPPLVAHLLRLGFDPAIAAETRAQITRTTNRFKQIHGPRLFVVGLDVSAKREFDLAQISLFSDEKTFRDYFFDPIHLAADREAESVTGVKRGASFDVLSHYTTALAAHLREMVEHRSPAAGAPDSRPSAPPVPDREVDQRWSHGKSIFFVARFGLPDNSANAQRAFDRIVKSAGSNLLAAGGATKAPNASLNARGMVARFDGLDAYRGFASGAPYQEARQSQLFANGASDTYCVIDPADHTLADPLRPLL
jgi:uncharacterized protein (DUF1330 family)